MRYSVIICKFARRYAVGTACISVFARGMTSIFNIRIMYKGQLKTLLTSTYVRLITMQNMLAPLPDVMFHRLSARDFGIAAVIITQCSIRLFYTKHETNNIKFFEFTRECIVNLQDINKIHSV
jgi:hypothetical protein